MERLLLNGKWEIGINRHYTDEGMVPGLVSDPKIINDGVLWYKKSVKLPEGSWSYATLLLKGARFCPSIYVNGDLVSLEEGGMAPTYHLLKSSNVYPGAVIDLEVALQPLDKVAEEDASRIPEADRWRSNVASCLWDDVELRFHGGAYIKRIIPNGDFKNDCIDIDWQVEYVNNKTQYKDLTMVCSVLDKDKHIIQKSCSAYKEQIHIELDNQCKPWSPEEPHCYTLRLQLMDRDHVMDQEEMTIGLKNFEVQGIGFMLNNRPVTLRAGSVVWHRWLRDEEAKELAFSKEWFEKNVVKLLKDHGANTLRFHLGMPPESFLDLCDQYGLLVQAEWIFFHDMKGSERSLVKQWRNWLDLCMRHPSVALIHGWNETEDHVLEPAFRAIEKLRQEYPPLVISHIDVIHIHKYWWSLFENVGLYYDSAKEFDRPIMVDEFGGNYLDSDGNEGGYPTVKESFLRFLGKNHTKDMRLQLQKNANGKIAEYWRRIGAAGYSPFCMLGSPEDGNHHYIGKLEDGHLKPVWKALPTVYSPLSCSLEVWDRNYSPGDKVTIPLHFFNDTHEDRQLIGVVRICLADAPNIVMCEQTIVCKTKAHGKKILMVTLQLPEEEGNWVYQAMLTNPPEDIKYPVLSEWYFRTLIPTVPEGLLNKKIGVPDCEPELQSFLLDQGLRVLDSEEEELDIIIGSKATWDTVKKDMKTLKQFRKRIHDGCSVIMLDVGPSQLYLPGHTEALASVYKPKSYDMREYELFDDLRLKFQQVPEPESCIHPIDNKENLLWNGLSKECTWLWNGLRGGLIVPTWDMEVSGLGADDIIAQWVNRGADKTSIQEDNYYAYELAGYYAFSIGLDQVVEDRLRERVRFLIEDAPALKVSIDPEGPIKTMNLSKLLKSQESNTIVNAIQVLACCGRNLTRTPVIQIAIGGKGGQLLLSQLLTKGRLVDKQETIDLYDLRKDVAAQQFVLNMMEQLL